MMHPSIKRKTVFGARPTHLPLRGLRRLGYAPLLPDGTWIQRQPGEPDQKIQGAPPDLSIPYLKQTVSLVGDGIYLVPAQPAGSTNFTPDTSRPVTTPVQPLVGDAGPAQIPGSPQPGTMDYVLAAEQKAEANAVPITYSSPPSALPLPQSTDAVNAAMAAAGNSFVPSPTTVARAQAAAGPAPSWFDGSTTILGFTLSNSTLAFGGVALAAALYYFSGKRKGR